MAINLGVYCIEAREVHGNSQQHEQILVLVLSQVAPHRLPLTRESLRDSFEAGTVVNVLENCSSRAPHLDKIVAWGVSFLFSEVLT